MELIRELHIPRWHRICPNSRRELHIFVDAGESGFAAVAYFRGKGNKGEIVVSIVMAKSKVSPLRAVSIPRLELMAAVLGARLANTICQSSSIKIDQRFFWTDSKDVLFWINSPHRRYRQFVALRVNELLDKTKESEWRFVPTQDNAADDATKIKPSTSPRWLSGPPFLYQDSETWPVCAGVQHHGPPDEELQQVFTMKQVDLGAIPDVNRFSKWTRLRNSTAYVLRVVLSCKQHGRSQLPDEIARAEEELFRAAQ